MPSDGRGAPVDTPIRALRASAYVIPTDGPESDGTHAWDHTTMVLVQADAGGETGLGYSYTHGSAVDLIRSTLADCVHGHSAFDVDACRIAMVHAVRNIGQAGLTATAISAVEIALWDLKARLLDLPLVSLLGAVRDGVEVYGSGGFTSYSMARLEVQLGGWAEAGIRAVKMKVGRDGVSDRERVRAARKAVGSRVELFVDANGAYTRKQALAQAEAFADDGVSWFEEPVSSGDLAGLRLVRDRGPSGMAIAAGEYGYSTPYFRRMVAAGAVDVLQADATRCLGVRGFLDAGVVCDAWGIPLSAHTAPSLHVHLCCAAPRACHLEYFHDHVRIEQLLFDGAPRPVDGRLVPDRARPGLGLDLRDREAERFAA